MNVEKGLKNIMQFKDIIKHYETLDKKELIKRLVKNKNGKLRTEIQEKDKKIEELEEQINNPLNKMREVGII